MEYRKKLRIRLIISIILIVVGLGIIITSNIITTNDNFFSPFGFALVIISIVRIRNHFIITKSEDSIKKQEIAETDERNILISNKAKSVSFYIYLMLSCVSVIVLQLINKAELATVISLSVCVMLIIYWISYLIIRKKY